jgi:mono/diheme cytochrome c family protein
MVKRAIVFVLMSVMILTACGTSSGSSNEDSNTPLETVPADYAGKTNPYAAEAATDGAKVFKSSCEMCHGPEGHGDGPAGQSLDPKPKNLAVLQKSAGDDFLFWRISQGKPGTSMIAWQGVLSEDQIWQVVSFIRTLKE